MTLLALVSEALTARGIGHAVIGATALAAHGVSRATADLDLLATDPTCLEAATWAEVAAAGVRIDLRGGDVDDPLAGVIRITRGEDPPVDVIVGRGAWQTAILARAARVAVGGATVPVVTPADLVLLKLYAGGPQDAWDVAQLLDAAPAIAPLVEASLPMLPAECGALWREILQRRG